MNLLQGPVGQSLPPPTEAGPGFQCGNKFDIDMCVHAAQGSGGADGAWGGRGEGVNKLVADLFTLPVATVRRAKTKQKTENRERKQQTENRNRNKNENNWKVMWKRWENASIV